MVINYYLKIKPKFKRFKTAVRENSRTKKNIELVEKKYVKNYLQHIFYFQKIDIYMGNKMGNKEA